MKSKNYVTLKELIKELEQLPEEWKEYEVVSIGSWCGGDRPADYTISLKAGNSRGNRIEIMVGRK